MHACMSKNFMVFDVDCSMIPGIIIDRRLGSKANCCFVQVLHCDESCNGASTIVVQHTPIQSLHCYFLASPVTTGILKFAECFYVCRVYFLGHSANKFFAECCDKNTRQKKTLGKEGVCRVSKKTLGKQGVCPMFSFLQSAKK